MNTEELPDELKNTLKGREPHNPDEIRVRVRDEGQPFGTGTNIIFRFDDETGQSAIDKIATWLTLMME